MAWKKQTTSPEEIAAEIIRNLQRDDSARVLILGTDMPDGYRMRLTLKNPEAVAGIIYNHAMKTGETEEALQMAAHLTKIGAVAIKLIHEAIEKAKARN